MVSVQQLWKREYSDARYQAWPNKVDPVELAAFRLREKLRSISLLRPGQRIINIPGIGVQTSRRAVSVAAGWWAAGGAPTPIAVYQPKGAADLATSYVNLVTPGTYNAAPGTAPTHASATGWTFTKAAGTYLTTGIVPATGWSHVIRYVQTNSDVASPCESGDSTSNGFGLRCYPGSNLYVLLHGSGSSVGGPYISSAVLAQAGRQCYVNGIAQGSPAGDASFTTSRALYIGGSNTHASVPQLLFTGSVAAYAVWDTSINHATWMPAVMAAVALI